MDANRLINKNVKNMKLIFSHTFHGSNGICYVDNSNMIQIQYLRNVEHYFVISELDP